MFHLLKWYGDCISSEGHCCIGYWAELRWNNLHLRYVCLLEAAPGTAVKTRSSLRAGLSPAAEGSGFRWREPLLGVDWRWLPRAAAHQETLLVTEEGRVHWSCLAPSAAAWLTLGAQKRIEGEGYLEQLEMTLPPWSLPIDTLLWGRYLSDAESLVWIDWRGPHQRRLVLRDGLPVQPLEVEAAQLLLAGGETLLCDRGLTLREGALGPNVLSSIPVFDRLLPLRLLQVHEHKWLSRAALSLHGAVLSRGWAIHEVVRWP